MNLRWWTKCPLTTPSYFAVDARVAWNIHDGLELAVTGQNLTDNQHAEFGAQTIEPPLRTGAGVYAKIDVAILGTCNHENTSLLCNESWSPGH